MAWFRVTFRGPQLSPAARAALDIDDIGLVHDRDAERDDLQHHAALVRADTGEGAIDMLMTAVEVHGPYDFFEAFVWPPEGTMDGV
jgi:hypothetical protein